MLAAKCFWSEHVCICASMCLNVLLFTFLNSLFMVQSKEFCLKWKTNYKAPQALSTNAHT